MAIAAIFAAVAAAQAADPASCKKVRFSDVGWTDITATTALTSRVLTGLGYEPSAEVLSVPVTYTSMKNKDIDVFLGNWMPTMEADRKPYVEAKTVEIVGVNLEGAKYTLAVPTYTYEAGLKSFADVAKFRDKLDGKIYGIEPGNDGNRLILDMIAKDSFGMKGFNLVESSEQGMLAQVQRAVNAKQDIVFLGWEPHPMNTKFDMKYLSGGDDVFGPNYGGATVYTNTRAGYVRRVPQSRHAPQEPHLRAQDGERGDGLDPVRRHGRRAGGRAVAEEESGGARQVARRRHDLRRAAGPRRGEEEPRTL